MNPEQRIKDFFQQEIFDLDEDDIDKFLNSYSSAKVVRCLFDTLISPCNFEYGYERSWLLGKIFGSISNNYSSDTEIFLLFETRNLGEKKSFLAFFSGYWDNVEPNVDMVAKIATDIVEIIRNPNHLIWDQEAISLGVEAVVLGYLNNKKLFQINENLDNNLVEIFKFFKKYLSNSSFDSPAHQLLSENFD